LIPPGARVIPQPRPAGAPPAGQVISPTARQVWRRLRFPLVIAAVILVGGAIVVLLQPRPTARYLDPGDPGPFGARALSQILAQRGHAVVRASSAAQAARAAATAQPVTVVVTNPQYLDAGQLTALARLPGDRVLVEPDASTLKWLAPGVQLDGQVPVQPATAGCGLGAARLAGDADAGGLLLRAAVPGAARCYPVRGEPSLVSYGYRGRTITVLGTGAPLTNGDLVRRGDAALALNLLESHPTVVWLTPGAAVGTGGAGGSPGAGGQSTLADLVPWPVYLIAIQLAVAAAVAAIWRMRRLGPLVPEPLPVVVRASETVEGHGRLYRARGSRDRAAAALRGALLDRVVPALGLSREAGPDTITAAIAARSGRAPAEIAGALYGGAPRDDAALVRLADTLDGLEREVHQS
jgi:hypothetical protein